MGLFPWGDADDDAASDGDPGDDLSGGGDPGGGDPDGDDPSDDEAAIVDGSFQDGSLSVYEDRVRIERPGASRFESKAIDLDAVVDVRYSGGWVVGYLQIEEREVEADEPGLVSSPVDENTLHFGAGGRDAAQRARDAIRDRRDLPDGS